MTTIPKRIHYIWFGGAPMPPGMLEVIDGWRNLMPDYEVIEWNETNIDVKAHPWMSRMLEERQYAFASDFARLWVLHEHGGIYMDTDVVVKKSIEPLLSARCLWSFELDAFLATCVIAAEPGHPLLRALMAEYDGLTTARVNNALVTAYFLRTFPEFHVDNKEYHLGDGIRVLPKEYMVVPAYDRSKNFAVHNSSNPWRHRRRKLRFGWMIRPILGDVLFYKLINLHMNLTSELPPMDKARARN